MARAGRALWSQSLPYLHFVFANIGLPGMILSWAASRYPKSPVPPWDVVIFGVLVIISVWLFAVNIAMTVFY